MKQTRARAPEAKTARREQILSAAQDLFEAQPYKNVTMAAIARHAGLAKGTTYIYFQTKEALFLEVVIDHLDKWYTALLTTMDAAVAPLDAETLAELLAASLSTRPSMLRLLSLLHSVLERNISLEMALKVKRMLRGHLMSCGARLEVLLPHLAPGQGARLLQHLQACVVGYFQATTPPPVVARALEDPELSMFKLDFYTELKFVITMVLTGVEKLATQG